MKMHFALSAFASFVCAAHALAPVSSACAPSAEAAISQLLTHTSSAVPSAEGFRVVAVRRDPIHQSAWAMVASCADPARPMQAFLVGASAQAASVAAVRIGDHVTLVRQGADSRMELTAFARDTGALNDVVRVQMPRLNADDEQAAPIIRCKVVGPDVVEPVLSLTSLQESNQ